MSLWESRKRRAVSPLDGVVARAPTETEVRVLREAAERAERESPFQDGVRPEAMDRAAECCCTLRGRC